MNITSTFSLEPKLQDSVWYIQWASLNADVPGADDTKIRARWNTYSKKHCTGKDAFGKYYESKKHAMNTIHGFKKQEAARRSKGSTT